MSIMRGKYLVARPRKYEIILTFLQVPFKPTVDITWNVVTLQLHFKCECGEQYCVSNISTKNIGSNQNLCN